MNPHNSIKSNRPGKLAASMRSKANAPTEPIALAQHTPGPWTYQNNGGAVVMTGGDRSIVFLIADHRRAIPNTEDARLIAAAPEMLEALNAVANAMISVGADKHQPKVYAKICAAIAKAVGGGK